MGRTLEPNTILSSERRGQGFRREEALQLTAIVPKTLKSIRHHLDREPAC